MTWISTVFPISDRSFRDSSKASTSNGWGGRPYLLGANDDQRSIPILTSEVSITCAIDLIPKESAARKRIFITGKVVSIPFIYSCLPFPSTKVIDVNVSDIKPGMKRIDVTVEVAEIFPVREVTSRKDGSKHSVEEVLVGDETGSIILSLWDNDVGKLKEGDVIKIENGYTTVVRGSLRLNVGRYGKIELVDENVKANTENNLSDKQVRAPKRYGFPKGGRF